MTTKPVAETSISKDGDSDTPASPATMHRPNHNALDTADVAAHDEMLHEAALRDSMLRVPR